MRFRETFRKHRQWWALGVSLVLLAGLLVVAIGDGDDEPADTTLTSGTIIPGDSRPVSTTPASTATTASGLRAAPLERNPLTGAPLEMPGQMQVIAVNVGNSPAERPQRGLGEADLIFETVLEGGLTRFTALYFTGAPQVVGPVRSIRPVDAAVLTPFQPLFAFSGGQDFVFRLVAAAGINSTDEAAGEAVYPGPGVPPYHLLLDFPSARALAIGGPPAEPIFAFSDETPFSGVAAREVALMMGAVEVEYRFEEGRGYVRAQDGRPFETVGEAGSPEPLVRETIVVQFVAQRSAGYRDVNGAEVPDFDVVGLGPAVIFHAGQAVTAEWRRANQASGTNFHHANGQLIPLPVGTLLVELAPAGSRLSYQ